VVDDEAGRRAQAGGPDAAEIPVAGHDQGGGARAGGHHFALDPTGAGHLIGRPSQPLTGRGKEIDLG